MSKKHKKTKINLNDVSNSILNISTIQEDKKNSIKEQYSEYKEFCDEYMNKDFSIYNIEELRDIHEIANELLNQYFITQDYKCEADVLIQLQYIVSETIYCMNIKQANDTNIKNQELNRKLGNSLKEIKHMKNDIKSIMTTIISTILAISIIPTAIAGIDKVSSNYILPFLSSIILFGIIMITFVYSIYQDKLKKSTWIFLILAIIICSVFWFSSFDINIDIKTTNKIENNQEGVNSVE